MDVDMGNFLKSQNHVARIKHAWYHFRGMFKEMKTFEYKKKNKHKSVDKIIAFVQAVLVQAVPVQAALVQTVLVQAVLVQVALVPVAHVLVALGQAAFVQAVHVQIALVQVVESGHDRCYASMQV